MSNQQDGPKGRQEKIIFHFKRIDNSKGGTDADMNHISRAIFAAIEYYRIGDERHVDGTPEEIAIGKAIIDATMSCFALECALKGLFQALGKDFSHDHDLLHLFDELPQERKDKIEAVWREWTIVPETQQTTLREFVEMHRTDYHGWRFFERRGIEFSGWPWIAATQAVYAATRSVNE